MKKLELRIPNTEDHIAIYYDGNISNVYLWEDGKDTLGSPVLEPVIEGEDIIE